MSKSTIKYNNILGTTIQIIGIILGVLFIIIILTVLLKFLIQPPPQLSQTPETTQSKYSPWWYYNWLDYP